MSEFESKDNSSDGTLDIGKRYVDTSYKYLKLKIFHLLATNITMLSKMIVIGGIFTIALIFVSLSGAIALGNYYENMPLGYLLVGFIFMLIGFIVYLVRDVFNKLIITNLSAKFFEVPKRVKSEKVKETEEVIIRKDETIIKNEI